MLSKNTSYISRLDHLRFLAALLVITYHFAGGTVTSDTINPLLVMIREGESGVGLFMVLSGFILTRISLGKAVIYKDFLYNRLLRIYPLYVLAICVAAYSSGRHMDFLSIIAMLSTVGVVANVALLPAFTHLWTIAVEFQFYLVFPFLVLFLGRYGAKYIAGFVVLALIIRGMMFLTDGTIKDAAYWTILGRIDQFCVGMLAAVLYARRRGFLSSPLALATSAAALYLWSMLWYRWTGGYYGANSPTSAAWIISPTIEALLWAALSLSYLNQKWHFNRSVDSVLCYLGSISFSLYVWHFPILMALKKATSADVFGEWYLNLALVALPLIIGLSSLSYFVVEKPFFALRRVYAKGAEPAPSPIHAPVAEPIMQTQNAPPA